MQILEGIKVMDLTRLLPGPVCTLIMADYGAEVIKLEDPWTGDPTRYFGPAIDADSSFFWQLNRNKKSLAIDLKSPEGAQIFKEVAANSDVILEGFRPGVMQRLGLSYDVISQINPAIIYASLSGYGQDGPYAYRAGHDLNYASLTGLLELNRDNKQKPPGVPPLQVADIGGGSLMSLAGIMMALFSRSRTGKGQYIDVSMADGLMPWLSYAASYYFAGAETPRVNKGEITGEYACYNIYQTSDGKYLSLGALEPVFWQNFCRFAGKGEWAEKQFNLEEQAALIEEVNEFFRQKSRDEWVKLILNEDFCCEPVLDISEASEHPHLEKRNFFIEVSRPDGTSAKQVGYPLKFSSDFGRLNLPPPKLGEHTKEVLNEVGFSLQDIEDFIQRGIIAKP